jgi:hypothetical protein
MAAKGINARPGRVIHPVREAPDPEALRRGSIIERLQRTLEDEETFRLFPAWLAQVLQEELWRRFCNPATFEAYEFQEFDQFVRTRRPRGLGVEGGTEQLYRECRFYADQGDANATAALAKLREMMPEEPTQEIGKGKAGPGRGKKTDDDIIRFEQGTDEAYLLRRLKRDYKDLAQQVIDGKMTTYKAALAAGIVKPMVRHLATVEGFARATRKHLTDTERLQLAEDLMREG